MSFIRTTMTKLEKKFKDNLPSTLSGIYTIKTLRTILLVVGASKYNKLQMLSNLSISHGLKKRIIEVDECFS